MNRAPKQKRNITGRDSAGNHNGGHAKNGAAKHFTDSWGYDERVINQNGVSRTGLARPESAEDREKRKIRNLKEAVSSLIETSRLTGDYYVMLVFASMIVCLGIMLNNLVIVTGGMALAPFLSPFLRLALAFVISDKKIIKGSLFIILKSAVAVFLASTVAILLVPEDFVDFELARVLADTNLVYFYISLISGFAAAWAWAKPNLSALLPAVAVSVTLLPPLVGIMISVWYFDFEVLFGSVRAFIANFLGTVLSATFVFALLGFYKTADYFKSEVEKENNLPISLI
jgi:uncharacterized hydrophobic protein (TIGR00271 family)